MSPPRVSPPKYPALQPSSSPVRLQKFMADAGVGSRRHCETLIAAGRVAVDGRIVTVQGCRVDPATSDVRLDGRRLHADRKIYLVLHKPVGVLCTNRDTHGRQQLADLLPASLPRLYSVGRLDKESAGLLLLTNDGDFSLRLTHPRYKIPKSYLVEVEGKLAPEDIQRLRRGVSHDGERLRAEKISNIRAERGQTRLLMVLAQGRKRQIRRMMTVVGHPVRRLTRVAIGPLRLGNLKSGQWRYLTDDEVHMLTAL